MSSTEVRTHLRERERDTQVISGEIIKNRNIHFQIILITVQEEVNSVRLHTCSEPAGGGREHTGK